MSAGTESLISWFFTSKGKGTLPLVSTSQIDMFQLSSPPVCCIYHLSVNLVVSVHVFVESGRITRSLSP